MKSVGILYIWKIFSNKAREDIGMNSQKRENCQYMNVRDYAVWFKVNTYRIGQ